MKANGNNSIEISARVKSEAPVHTAAPGNPWHWKRFLCLLAIAALTIALGGCKQTPGDDLAARVGNHDIKMDQVNSAVKQQMDSNASASGPLSPTELAAAQLSVLDNLIQGEALFQRALRENLVPDDSKVSEEIEKEKQQSGVTEDQYRQKLKDAGIDESAYREQVKKQLAINALKDKENTRVKVPTDDEIRKYYEDHRSQWVAEPGADISIIVSDPANNGVPGDAVGDAAAEQKINTIYNQLRSGLDFATVASQRSEDSATSVRGGELGFASESQLKQNFPTRPDLPARLMSMNPGQYTEPIRDNASGRWYIFKLNSKREQPSKLTFDDVRQTIIDTITQQRQQVLWNAIIMASMAESSVKNFLADRFVNNPETIIMMKPSELLTPVTQPQQTAPRIEDENAKKGGGDSSSRSPKSREKKNGNLH